MRAVVLAFVVACGGSQPAPEMAPLVDDDRAEADAGAATVEASFIERVRELTDAIDGAGGDCSRIEKAVAQFARARGSELQKLAADIKQRGTEQSVMDELAPAIESMSRLALACPKIDVAGLIAGPRESGAAGDLLSRARAGATLYWRLGETCHAWKLAGDTSGEMLRLSPGPVLRFAYELDEAELAISGSDERPGLLGELGAESLCRDRLALGASDGDGMAIGDGRWYDSLESCEKASARQAPKSCASRVSRAVVEQAAADQFGELLATNQSISVATEVDGAPVCATWKFSGRRGRKKLQRGAESFEVRYRDGVLHLTDQDLDVARIAATLYRVGEHVWFSGSDCAGLLTR